MKVKVKRKQTPQCRVCDPEKCDHCQYIGDGDFICDKYIHDHDRVIVVEDWQPTENYMQCQKEVHK